MNITLESLSDRLFRNWRTSLVSMLGFATIAYLGISKSVEWTTLSGWVFSAASMLILKDPGAEKRAVRKYMDQQVASAKPLK